MNIEISNISAIISGILILIFPEIINYIVAIYLIVIGVSGAIAM